MIERKRKNVLDTSKISPVPSPPTKKKKEEGTTTVKSQNFSLEMFNLEPPILEKETLEFPSNFSSKTFLNQNELDKLQVPSLAAEKKNTPLANLLVEIFKDFLMV